MIKKERLEIRALFFSIFLVSACAINYELLIGALSSYLFGDSVTQFSVTIGLFLVSMGLGSYLSRFIRKDLLPFFVTIEIVLSVVGGFSLILLYTFYAFSKVYTLLFIIQTLFLGCLTGLEIPLITRIIRSYGSIRKGLSSVLAFDYLGGLIASLTFPFLLLPYLGLIRSAFVTGLINLAAPICLIIVFRTRIATLKRYITVTISGIALTVALFFALPISSFFEKQLYQDNIIFSRQTPFQKIVLTIWKNDIRLFLNGNLQFSSIDEYRYHETLVHSAAINTRNIETVLVLGGGDGLAIRELLRYPTIRKIVLVDIDKVITDMGASHPLLTKLNKNALRDKRVTIVNTDAFKYLENKASTLFDLIIADFPDPNSEVLAKLYSKEFFSMVKLRMARHGTFITQSSSPFFAKQSYWTVHSTLSKVFPYVTPFHVYVPSFGEWGFNMAKTITTQANLAKIPTGLRFFSANQYKAAKIFPRDISKTKKKYKINTLNNPILHNEYNKGWKNYN